MSGNIQNKLRQTRRPRVHITLDVDASSPSKKELPFVLGVMGDFSGYQGEFTYVETDRNGDPVKDRDGKEVEAHRKLPSLTERNFVTIDRDNFDKVMAGMTPALKFRVDDKLSGGDREIPIDLRFTSLDDFNPASVAKQVPQLKRLMETRAKLRDLLTKADRSEKLEALLEELLKSADNMKTVSRALGPASTAGTE